MYIGMIVLTIVYYIQNFVKRLSVDNLCMPARHSKAKPWG